MSVSELYGDHPKPWTNIKSWSVTTDNLKVEHVSGDESARLKIPEHVVLPAVVPDAGHIASVAGNFYLSDGAAWQLIGPETGMGDVEGPASSTDNALARFHLETGKVIQNSTGTLSDGGDLQVSSLSFDGVSTLEKLAGNTATWTYNTVGGANVSTANPAVATAITFWSQVGWIVNFQLVMGSVTLASAGVESVVTFDLPTQSIGAAKTQAIGSFYVSDTTGAYNSTLPRGIVTYVGGTSGLGAQVSWLADSTAGRYIFITGHYFAPVGS